MTDEWFYQHSGRVYGPVSLHDLRTALWLRFALPTDLVKHRVNSAWAAAETFTELRAPLQREGDEDISNNARKTGFTLVEVLVVIGIIGLLVAMLLPAVQSVRESARRTRCSNNVRQSTLALSTYHEVHRRYPPQYGWSKDVGAGGFGTLFFHLLPFIEQSGVYDQALRTTDGFGSPGGYRIYAGTYDSRVVIGDQFITTYQCPSESSFGLVLPWWGWRASSYASNFQIFGNSASVNLFLWRNAYAPDSIARDNVLRWEGRKSARNVTDGLSKTMCFAEKFGNCNARGPLGSAGSVLTGGNMWGRWDYLDPWQPTFAADESFLGSASMFQDNPQPAVYPGPCNPAVAQTPHPSVMVTAFLDGSVRPSTSSIAANVWWNSITPAGGEP